MNDKEVRALLERRGAILSNGHFVYTSGRHGSVYINKDAIYPHTDEVSRLCRALAEKFSGVEVETVVAPAVGGVILSQWIAHHLGQTKKKEVFAVYAEKSGDRFVIKRGYDRMVRGKKVLVVEDILNTGGSVQKVVQVIRETGGEVVGVGALVNRGGVTADDLGRIPKLVTLASIKLDSWDPKECPLCAGKVPMSTEVGKGKSTAFRDF